MDNKERNPVNLWGGVFMIKMNMGVVRVEFFPNVFFTITRVL
jgi:hypothetical protein